MDSTGFRERVDYHQMPLDRRKSASTMEDGEQGDTCRICRGEGTIDQPLFYPCKCSGSIKFVHQDCLMEWLSHSQKKYCELCKTPFRFTKLYDQSMPATLPLPLFLRQIGVHAIRTVGRWLRYMFVTFIWICWLPWSIRQIWRGLFWLADGSWMTPQDLRQWSSLDTALSMGNTTANNQSIALNGGNTTLQSTSGSYFDPLGELFNLLTGAPLLRGLLRLLTTKPAPAQTPIADSNSTLSAVASAPSLLRQPSLLSNMTSLNTLTKYPLVNNGLVDILEGQLVCLSVIAAFILVFLIREWVINQQPILNMPNPEQADAQPAPAPANEEIRQPVRRRQRRFRRAPDREEQAENPVLDTAQRPLAMPRPRRSNTDENVATQSPDRQRRRPDVPQRSASLVPEVTGTDDIFHMDVDGESFWHPQDASDMEDLESPPLQRGIQAIDIRRNIEERGIRSSGHTHAGVPGYIKDNTHGERDDSSGSPVVVQDSDMDRVQRTDFVFGQNGPSDDTNIDANDHFTFSSPFNMAGADSTSGVIPAVPTEPSTSGDSDSPWERVDLHQNEDGVELPADVQPPTDAAPVVEIGRPENPAPDESEQANPEEDAVPETFLGRVAQWMWHTDPGIRVDHQNAELEQDEAAEDLHGRGRLLPAGNANGANVANVAQQPPNVPAHEPNIQLGVDINDPNALDDAEDLEGILELIGMEGPLAGMIQNIIFSVFLITLTLSASVWCPYIWGKIAILILSNPIGAFFKAPLYLVSKCGNILVDLLLFVGGLVGFGLSNLTKLVRAVIAPALPGVATRIKVAVVENWAYGISQNSGIRLEKALSGTLFGLRPDLPTFSMQSHHALQVFRRAFTEAFSAVSADLSDTIYNATSIWQSYGLIGLPVFVFQEVASFPGAAISASKKTGEWLYALKDDLRMGPLSQISESEFGLVEWTTEDKILAILIGYAFFAAAGYAYLKIAHAVLGLQKDEKVDGIFADSLRQAGGVLKVIIIIGIEMIAFPLYCGLLLDWALLPLFKEATVQSRLSFLTSAPITCLFIHWFVGTCYMFHFALFVSMCRKIMRKGVLYFIRDPDDPTFHPVRDVLERPVATQLGKIAFSALVYGGLVIVCLGGVVWTISGVKGVLPVNWATNEPRLAFPVDIVFYNFMLPFIIKRAEISKKISSVYEWWFRQCARALRLSHFLFGEEHEDEKRASRLFLRSKPAPQSGITEILEEARAEPHIDSSDGRSYDGRFVRVPAADSVRIPKGTKVFVDVNENNERIDGEKDRDKGMHGKKDDRFVKIFVPSYFRARIATFVFLVWLFAASTGVACTVLPLTIGRRLIRMAASSTAPPNDLYAFTVGMHICGIVTFTGYMSVSRKDKLRSRIRNMFTNTKESLPRLYQMVKHVLGLVYLAVTIFVILPFTTSLITELYVHMPIYSYFASALAKSTAIKTVGVSPSSTPVNPTIFVLQTWTLGLLYLRLALRFAISYPNGQNRPSTALRAITRNGYLRPDVSLASRALVFPALTVCIVLLAAPLGLARTAIVLTGTTDANEKLQFYRYSYPVLLGIALSVYMAVGLQYKIEGWRIKVRDEVYLVGERLHNFTDNEKGKGKGKNQTKNEMDKGKGKAVQGDGTAEQTSQVIGQQLGPSDRAVASGSSVG